MSKLTLIDAVESYLKTHLKKTTRRAYAKALHQMAKFVGENKPLKSITIDHLLEYQAFMYDDSGLAQATINSRIKAVKSFFNHMVMRGDVKTTPAKLLKTTVIDMYDDEDNKAMPDEVLHQLLILSRPFHRIHALALLLADSGCRIGGAANLKWGDIDFARREAKVFEKGDKTRAVAFGGVTATALLDWRKRQVCYQDSHGVGGNFVFSQDGSFLTAERLGQFFRRNCIKFGLGSWGPHSVRHHKGHQLGKAGVPSTLIARVLGHNSTRTTERYLPQNTSDGLDVAHRFSVRERDLTGDNDESKIIKFGS